MSIEIRLLSEHDKKKWDQYVCQHIDGNIYHLSKWRDIITDSYGHKCYYLCAWSKQEDGTDAIRGILPLVLIKSPIFGKGLYSLPFFDLGGMLTDNSGIESMLLDRALHLLRLQRTDTIELRQERTIKPDSQINALGRNGKKIQMAVKDNKVRMLLTLPESAEILMKNFKSKLRSQIKRASKAGLNTRVGGQELVNDFYKVFCVNMRDLGSPVHSKKMITNVIKAFRENSKIVAVYLRDTPIAAGLIVGFKNTMINPWSSALHRYSRLSANMLLYWSMLSYACENGYHVFDFGRSSPGEGTYNFKAQWGTTESEIKWIVMHSGTREGGSPKKAEYDSLINLWKKIPVSLSVFVGPLLRKYISL